MTRLIPILLLIALAALPFAGPAIPGGVYITRLAVIGLLYIASATAWDLVGGLTGQVSFGHSAFFGIGAYMTAWLVGTGWPMPLTLLPGALLAAAYGALWGWPCLRLRGPFFAIATIGVGEATRLIALLAEGVTGGATGLTLSIGGWEHTAYYLALGLVVVAFALSWLVRRSSLGLGLSCIREDVEAATSIGIKVGWLQVQALMLSAAVVAAAGGIYARYLYYVEPGDVFSFNRGIALILMATIGGLNSKWGPAIGAVIFLGLEQGLAAWFPQGHLGIYGLLLIGVMLYEPNGVVAFGRKLRGVASAAAR
ncbi:MAG TPA: branched-chain amino acid ABC transporter permease [Vicinamibacterales bacterium]|nr:branched-chain amino acid ABC transporter permease [Vicinamibacterales bacterium]